MLSRRGFFAAAAGALLGLACVYRRPESDHERYMRILREKQAKFARHWEEALTVWVKRYDRILWVNHEPPGG